ncbi:MAG: LysR family transcriptional regulator [Proteobacteria bacterium]|nr:LysR family transcriptional regulator [Pseudomonadota bacterium]
MQWDKLKTFYYVAKLESFTKTGQYLNISQSAISRQIIDLEYQVGHKLFKRLPKGLALTKQGQLLFQNTEKMFVFSELAITQIQNEQLEPQGELNIGANVGLVDTWLYTILPGFLKLYPNINLSILSKDGHLDVESLEVHVALQPYIPDQPELIQNLLTRWNRRLYASKEYLQQYGVPQKVEDLKQHRLIGFGPERIHLFDNINWHLKLNGDNSAMQKPYISVNSLRALFHFGNTGFGIISFSQESLLLKGSDLVEVLPEITGPSIEIYFTYPIQLKGIKKIEVLEEYLQAYVKEHHKKFISPSSAGDLYEIKNDKI